LLLFQNWSKKCLLCNLLSLLLLDSEKTFASFGAFAAVMFQVEVFWLVTPFSDKYTTGRLFILRWGICDISE
jgi:hypothetical protein